MRLMSDWESVVGVIWLHREKKNGEWRLENEADARLGICVGCYSVTSRKKEWRMENEADERLAICGGRYSVISRKKEWRMENGE